MISVCMFYCVLNSKLLQIIHYKIVSKLIINLYFTESSQKQPVKCFSSVLTRLSVSEINQQA